MIQFNLLPDVKLEFIKAKYRKRLVVGISIIASGVFLTIFLLLFLLVRVQQKEEIKDINRDITKYSDELKQIKDLDKILTIQNQLSSLPGLHNDKAISSRLFDYLAQLTPTQATISNVEVDFAAKTMTIKGNADELSTVNKFADTLKFTDYIAAPEKENEKPKTGKAFGAVVLTSFSVAVPNTVTNQGPAEGASYELSLSFDPIIFANIKTEAARANPLNVQPPVALVVPKIVSTRSEVAKPTTLFVEQPVPVNTEGR